MKIFVTGASGFVGRVLLQRLLKTTGHSIVALSRGPCPEAFEDEERLEWLVADLLDIASYRGALGHCDVIVHLAAITGKVDPHLYEHVIVEGTNRLLGAARDAGNLPILNVSTIASRFPELRSYPYAKAKQRAERLVHASGLRHTTIRPTIVLGPGSGVWDGIEKLANAPVGILFGSGEVEIQPIHVDDLVGCMAAILEEGRFKGESLDLGGPEKISIIEFWKTIRSANGKNPDLLVRLPLSIIVPMLRLAEYALYRFLPLTVGQLSMFRFSSVPKASTFQLKRARSMMNVAEMLDAAQEAARTQTEPANECDVFCRYLIGVAPSEYVIRRYLEGRKSLAFQQIEGTAFDETLLKLAASRPFLTGLASDLLAPRFGTESLRYAMVISAITGLVALGLLWLAARQLPADLERRREEGLAVA